METVNFEGRDYLFNPGKFPVGIVLVHEIMGLDEYAKSVAGQLSAAGYPVVVVDLFRGKHPETLQQGFGIVGQLKREEILDTLSTGLRLVKEKSGVQTAGSMGFCMGGGFALQGACNLDFSFCIDFYGMVRDAEEVRGLGGPVIMFLGTEDPRVTPWAFQNLLPAMTKHKKRIDVHLYPKAGHAFHRPGWEGHNAEAAKDAWAKTMAFLGERRRE